MKTKLLTLLLLATVVASSCKKDGTDTDGLNGDIDKISAPSNFSWSGSRDVYFSFGISDNRFQNSLHIIKVYVGNPADGGQLISKGAASSVNPFNTKLALASSINELYVEKVAPNGSSFIQKLTLTSDNLSVSLGSQAITVAKAFGGLNGALRMNTISVTQETSPDCNTGCNVAISNSDAFDMESNKTYCVTTAGLTINPRNINGGTLRICATGVTINGLNLNGGATLIVTSSGSVNMNNFNWNGSGTIKNFGTISVGNFKVANGSFVNQGTLNVNGDYTTESGTTSTNTGKLNVTGNVNLSGSFANTNSFTLDGNFNSNTNVNFSNSGTVTFKNNTTIQGTFTNSGTMTWNNGEVSFNSSPTFTNSGTITANNSRFNISGTLSNGGSVQIKTLQLQSNGLIINNCKFIVLENGIVDNEIRNYSYFKVGNDLNINSTGKVNEYNAAMFTVNYLSNMDGVIKGEGSTSLFKVTRSDDKVNNNGNAKFQGSLNYCDPSRTIRSSQFINGAAQACDVFIGVSNCNPEGNGNAPTPDPVPNPDSDGDGVIDLEDDFPTDPDKAFKNYSENYVNGGSTVAFEDNWPLQGDYDLNDIVINCRYLVVTNATNKVVEVNGEYTLVATGGTFQNGAGIQFNLPASSAKNFSSANGAALESNQDSVVVLLFSNSREQQATWNTEPGHAISPNKKFSFTFSVVNGPSLSAFGVGNYNPFIWNNSPSYGRGYETHLFGKRPTSKANTTLFGTGNDASGNGRYYGTAQNLPWGIQLPIANFEYPNERAPITEAYKMFSNWAVSGGSLSTDWFSNNSPAFRDDAKLFKIK